MKTFLGCSFVLLSLSAFATGCSDTPSTPTSPSAGGGSWALTADQLAGTWALVSIQPSGQPEQARPAGATYTVTFADGRLSTRADCNICAGAFTLAGNTLTTGAALACTRAACPTMAFETAYTGILGGESTATLSGNALALSSSPRGVLRFAR